MYFILSTMYLLIHQCFRSLPKQVVCVYLGVPRSKKIINPPGRCVKVTSFFPGVGISKFPCQLSLLFGFSISPWPRFLGSANTKKGEISIKVYRYTSFTPSSLQHSSSPAGNLGKKRLQEEGSDPVVSQPLVWTWDLNPYDTIFCYFSVFLNLEEGFYRRELPCFFTWNPASFPYQNFKVGWSARRLCQTPNQCF